MELFVSNILATPICHYNCDHLKAEADEQEGQAVSRHLSRDCLAINISKPTVPPFMATLGPGCVRADSGELVGGIQAAGLLTWSVSSSR